MFKKVQEMIAELGANITSPAVLPAIDQALTVLADLRKVAVRLHGDTAATDVSINALINEISGYAILDTNPTAIPAKNKEFDGSLGGLAVRYRQAPAFLELRYKTREHYNNLMRIIEDQSHLHIAQMNAGTIKTLHEDWETRGDAMASALVGMLRLLIGFGASKLEDEDCQRVLGVLTGMNFPAPKVRTTNPITAHQVVKLRAKAWELCLPNIELAQAIQFECKLRQKDVIGEWVPASEPGESNIKDDRGMKWLRGLRWENIDKDLVLRHVSSWNGEKIEIDLKRATMVMEELEKQPRSHTGPLIVDGATGLPYRAQQFRREWRTCARRAGLSDEMRNMDSKPKASKN